MKTGINQYKIGDSIDMYLLIKSAKKATASNGKAFLTLHMSDKSGEIEAKLWGIAPEDEATFVSATIVHVTGEIQEFRGMRQLKIKSIRPTTSMDQVKPADFLPSAPLDPEEMLERVTQYIFEMQNAKIQRITRHLFKKHQVAFSQSPAATKNHHEFVSGLAYHVVSMLELAKSIATLYPSLDRDLLYAGIILHDLGKVRELAGPIVSEYTLEGKLLGHISIIVNEIDEAAKELEIEGEEVLVLQHLVLSHHGKGEWGSPKPPLIREAEILHMIDNIDAKMNMMDRALMNVKPGEFSERIFPMENRSLYKPTFHDEPLDL
ncbi:3'-5' exoribonuclease YhaM [Evansella cellulosilytica]|uniref:Metal dependent phosphohydrolase n=1 Tax=Evansella cellulosilytica (strain ATCC 21833 / DSM 2522 / FERM P-1141 / JCM 9156 / N-4) TaxID=649639 RepID=E6TUG9_EVAC2|nr:3'-5' exoribonuclease YhaM [Evansella cellulosilytica]ADU29725.1 metal dependent phosphohydrolase [Evansella cellulosilytica DSM 2522]